MLSVVLSTFKVHILKITSFYILDSLIRVGFSILLYNLFLSVSAKHLKTSFVYVGILVVLWYLSVLFKQTGSMTSYMFGSQLKAGLSMLLFSKLSQLTAFSLQSSDLGKITSLLGTDLSVMEQRIANVLILPAFPIILLLSTGLLYIRIGWIGLAAVATVVVVMLISRVVSSKGTEIVTGVYAFKDKRIHKTT